MQAGPPVSQLPPEGVTNTTETPPRRGPGRPRGSRNRPDTVRGASLETRIGGMLVVVNASLLVIPPLRRDALDSIEIAALAKALDSECRTSPRFRKYMEAALAAGSGGQLLGVVAIIGARRAARHGMLPPEIDQQFGNMLAGSMAEAPPPPPPTSGSHDGQNGTA